jgi:hypothetical protein
MLHILRRLARRASDVAEIAFDDHSQQAAQKIQRVMTGVSCRSLETPGISRPELVQALAKFLNLPVRQSPGARIEYFAFGFFFS